MYINKPTGYSAFPYEVRPTPKGWVEGGANLVFFREHTQGGCDCPRCVFRDLMGSLPGGHFAAMERPQALAKDILDFLRVALNAGS
jgi:microsomal epoxide hydrolase